MTVIRQIHSADSISRPRVLSAELIRTKHSLISWFPLLGILIGLMNVLFSSSVNYIMDTRSLMNWQSLYVTGLAAPFMTLLAGMAEERERRAREGGTNLRPVSPLVVRAWRLVVLGAISLAFHLVSFAVPAAIAISAGYPDWGIALWAGLLAWVASLPVVALFTVVVKRTAMIPALLLAAVWQVAGTIWAESPIWLMVPPSWQVRLLLPPLGVHANATFLEADSPLVNESFAVPLALNLLLLAVGAFLAIVVPQRVPRVEEGHRFTAEMPHEPVSEVSLELLRACRAEGGQRGKTSGFAALGAVNRALIRTAASVLAVLAVVGAWAMSLLYRSEYITGAVTFAVFPLGAGLLPVITWPALEEAWTLSRVENPRVRGALSAWYFLLIGIVAAASLGRLWSRPIRSREPQNYSSLETGCRL